MNRELLAKVGKLLKKYEPEIIESLPEVLDTQVRGTTFLRQICAVVTVYIPKKKPKTHEEIEKLVEHFRIEMENAWIREEQKQEEPAEGR